MPHTVTLREVAEYAGVSMGTASQALNHRPNVAPETRSRVVDAAVTLGYPLKTLAGASGPTLVSVIGLLTRHDAGLLHESNSFYSSVQAGVEGECSRHQISLMYATIEVDASNRPVTWPAMIREQQVDALILAGTFVEETMDIFQQRVDIPIVLVGGYSPQLLFDSVVVDNVAAAALAVEHLIQQGHNHIGILGWNEQAPPSIQDRKLGYSRALKRHNIEQAYVQPSLPASESGATALLTLLQQHPEITAVFACNDVCALGVLSRAREVGLRVPQDLSVIGFDNIDMSKVVRPALTTVHVYKTWLGILGVRQLLERVHTPEQPKQSIVLSSQLIVRESVGAPRKHTLNI